MASFGEALEAEAKDPQLEELRRVNASLYQQLVKLKNRTQEIVDAVYRAARDAHAIVGPAAAVPAPRKDKRTRKAEVCLVHTTDWQVGKITQTYNSDIARSRLVDRFCDKIGSLTEVQRSDHPVRRCDFMFGGDMIEGITIFPGQAYAVDSTLFEQLFNVVNIAESQLRYALTVFDQVHAWFEKGNHGRIGRKGENPAGDNFDLIAYEILKQRFTAEKRIVFHDLKSPGIWNEVHIGNYRALLAHGDEIKGFGGNIPAFGILRKLSNWAVLTRGSFQFTDAYLGHFHTTQRLSMPDGGAIFMTGSPESDNDYATEFMGAGGDPTQRIHFVDAERGRVTAEYVVVLDG